MENDKKYIKIAYKDRVEQFDKIFIELLGGGEVAHALQLKRDGYNYSEISKLLDINCGTIKYRMLKANKIIKKLGLKYE